MNYIKDFFKFNPKEANDEKIAISFAGEDTNNLDDTH
jgi:hypothetical protein